MVRLVRVLAILALAIALVGWASGSSSTVQDLSRVLPSSIEFANAAAGTASFHYACHELDCWELLGKTTDGGDTWTIDPRARHVDALSPPIMSATPQVAYTWKRTGTRSRLLRSDDAGARWVDRTHPCPSQDAFVLSFASATRGWMLCRIGGHGIQGDQVQAMFETRDGAQTWRRIGGTPPILSGLELVPGRAWSWWDLSGRELAHVYVSGLDRLSWHDAGFGRNESQLMGVESFDAISADIAYALVRREDLRRYELRRTTNGGSSWTVVHVWSFAWAYGA